MISTVTTTVFDVISMASAPLIGSLGLAAVITLIGSLVIKELAGASEGGRAGLFGLNLNVAILPLLFVFAFIVAQRVLEILAKT